MKDEAGAAQALEWTYTYTDAHRLASASVTLPAHDWSPPANVTTSYSAPSMAPATEAANAVDQYEEVAESVNSGSPTNSALSYDVRGNLISDTVWTYTYDLENRMLTATASGTSCSSTCTYAYDPMGRRVSKTVGGRRSGCSVKTPTRGDEPYPYRGRTPADDRSKFQVLGQGKKSTKLRNIADGSIWERDVDGHGGGAWKRWPDERAWKDNTGRQTIRADGSLVDGPGDAGNQRRGRRGRRGIFDIPTSASECERDPYFCRQAL